MNKSRWKWLARQLLPLRYESRYRDANGVHHVRWRMWFGKVFAYDNYLFKEVA